MSTSKSTKVKVDGETNERNWALPNQIVSLDEVQATIKSAEKGPFHTIQESMEHFEQWLKSRKRK